MLIRGFALCLMLFAIGRPAPAQTEPPAEAPPPAPPTAQEPTVADMVQQARSLLETGNVAQAAEIVRRLLAAAPENLAVNLLAGDVSLAANDFDSARNYYMLVLSAPGQEYNYTANVGIGKIWLANRLWRQATVYLEKADTVAPPDARAEVKRLLAYAYFGMGASDRAIQTAQAAVQADPDSLDALSTLVDLRQSLAERDPRAAQAALADADFLVRKAGEVAQRSPWSVGTLERLSNAYQAQLSSLRLYLRSLYQVNVRREPTDRLIAGRGPDAAAALKRMSAVLRHVSLLGTLRSEHDGVLLLERAVTEEYDADNVEILVALVRAYLGLQELTASVLVGPEIAPELRAARVQEMYRQIASSDPTMRDRAVSACQRILAIDPGHAFARDYLATVGAPETPPPTEE